MSHEVKEQDHILPNALLAKRAWASVAIVSTVVVSHFVVARQRHSHSTSWLFSQRPEMAISSYCTNV
jgi:hypothetical protein